MNFKCRNLEFRRLAELQGPLDTKYWPIRPYSGSTGGHPGYGWRHDHMVTNQDYVRMVIQCYAARPAYYDAALLREGKYNIGSRPLGWKPEDDGYLEGDLITGQWLAPNGAVVSGPDGLHIPLSPLVSIARSTGFTVKTEDGEFPAEEVAMRLLKYLSHAHAGMLRKIINGKMDISPYFNADRQQHYVFRTLVDGITYGFVNSYDLKTFIDYIARTVLPYWQKVPYGSDIRVYNGLHWVLPAIYDAYVLSPESELKEITHEILLAKAKLCVQLAKLVPGKACFVNEVKSWEPTKEGITLAGEYIGPWGIRSMLCAAQILEGEEAEICQKEGMGEFAKWNGKPEGDNKTDWKCWAVGANGEYLWSSTLPSTSM